LSFCIDIDHSTVCIEDTQNIYGTEEGVLLDNPKIVTLQHPEEHSFHCLLDVSSCYKSGFRVLGEKDPATDRQALVTDWMIAKLFYQWDVLWERREIVPHVTVEHKKKGSVLQLRVLLKILGTDQTPL